MKKEDEEKALRFMMGKNETPFPLAVLSNLMEQMKEGEKTYIFSKKELDPEHKSKPIEGYEPCIEIKESELKQEHIDILFMKMVQQFHYMPGKVRGKLSKYIACLAIEKQFSTKVCLPEDSAQIRKKIKEHDIFGLNIKDDTTGDET